MLTLGSQLKNKKMSTCNIKSLQKIHNSKSEYLDQNLLREQIISCIRRDLERLNWEFILPSQKNLLPTLIPPPYYDKEIIRKSMSFKRKRKFGKK